MRMARWILPFLLLSAVALAQPADTGTAHKAVATALLNSNNTGAAHLACPASIFPEPTSTPPGGGPPRTAGAPAAGRGAAGGRGAGGRGAPPPRENWYAEGGQVFDNLYMLTTKANSAWAVKTSAGIILIDTLFGYAAQDEIVDGMKKTGARSRPISSTSSSVMRMAITMAPSNSCRTLTIRTSSWRPKTGNWPARQATPYTHDMDATDGQKLTLGDTTITIYITPGHTGGTLSFLVPVKDHGVPHVAMEWGGTALSGNTSKEMLQSYISNAARMKDIADGAGADVIIGNHTEYNDALESCWSGPKRGNPAIPTLGGRQG
jgi:metallo-beta-lactamase class B